MSAKFDVDAFLLAYDRLDAALVAKGFPATSPWWRAELERFLRSGRRRWVLRVGRRGGKSSTLCRLAVAWALRGSWSVPLGDTALIPFVSVDRGESGARLRTIRDILVSLKVPHEARTDEIELKDRRCVFAVKTCSVTGTVGFTAIMLVGDEMARWESRDAAANPAKEVMGTLRPTTATQPYAFEVCSSSPWGEDDYHAELFDLGETEHQCASFAETWVANPTISEAFTHVLEPDPRVWAREYGALPGATTCAALDHADVVAAFETAVPRERGSRFIAIDPSSLRHDAFAVVTGRELADGTVIVDDVSGVEGEDLRRVSMAEVVTEIARHAHLLGVGTVYSDQRESAALTSMFSQLGLRLEVVVWTEPLKADAFQLLRRMLREGRLLINVPHDKLRHELTSVKVRMSPSGRELYDTNGKDYIAAILTYLMARLTAIATFGAEDDALFTMESIESNFHGSICRH